MNINDEILLNRYAQGLVDKNILLQYYQGLESREKLKYLNKLLHLIIQSEPIDADIEHATIVN